MSKNIEFSMTEDQIRSLVRGVMVSAENARKWLEGSMMLYKELMSYYRCAIMEIETKFNVLNEELSLQYDHNPIESIKSRLKSPESIAEKLKRKNLLPNIEAIENNITDIAGIRVICSFPSDIYMLADALLAQDDVTLVQKKDYIENPKPNGYRSMHLIVETPIFLHDRKKFMKVEVQLRTISMDWWASLEHKIKYKKAIKEDIASELEKELLECAQMSARLDARMEEISKRARSFEAEENNDTCDMWRMS